MALKRIIPFVLLCSCVLFSCKKDELDYDTFSKIPPETIRSNIEYGLDFNEMQGFVIDSLQSEFTPFFYIVNGKFDISGDNEKKEIVVKCTCLNGCVLHDVDLFFSAVLNLMAINASEQDYKFIAPSTSDDGTYKDYGTVFNTYSLRLFADTESGEVLRDTYIVNGTTIPIDPRYIKEY